MKKNNFVKRMKNAVKGFYSQEKLGSLEARNSFDMTGILGNRFFFSSKFENHVASLGELLNSYNKNPVVRAGVDTLASKIADIPHYIVEVKPNGEEVQHTNHEILDLLNKPNSYQTGKDFLMQIWVTYYVAGDVYIKIKRDDNGDVQSLMIQTAGLIRPTNIKADGRLNGEIELRYVNTLTGETIEENDYLIIRNLGVDPLRINSELEPILGLSKVYMNALEYQATTLSNKDAKGNRIITLPEESSPIDVEEFKKAYKEFIEDDETNVIIGKEGLEIKELRMSPKECDYIKTIETTKVSILRALKIPELELGKGENANRSTAEVLTEVTKRNVIKPKNDLYKSIITEQLIHRELGLKQFAIENDDILTKEIENESQMLFNAYTLGLISKEEIQKRLDFNEQEGEGATYYDPITEQGKESEKKNILKKKYNHYFRKETKEKVKQEYMDLKSSIKDSITNNKDVKSLLKKKSKLRKYTAEEKENFREKVFNRVDKTTSRIEKEIKTELDKTYKSITSGVGKYLKPKQREIKNASYRYAVTEDELKRTIRNLTKKNGTIPHEKLLTIISEIAEESVSDAQLVNLKKISETQRQKAVTERLALLSTQLDETTLNKILKIVSDNVRDAKPYTAIVKDLRKTLLGSTTARAELIARTETTNMLQKITLETFKQNGYKYKMWVNRADNIVREYHRNKPTGVGRVIVKIGATFPVKQKRKGGFVIKRLQHPDEYRCRCVLFGATAEEYKAQSNTQ